MKLSWSHKLFLRINKTLGKRPFLDKIMYFCGQWLIFIMMGVMAIPFFQEIFWFKTVQNFVAFLCTVLFAYALSYTVALIVRHPRPIKELPNVKELIIPIETWKSFPSDHTIAATLLVLNFLELGSEGLGIFMIVCALLVMVARVYCGVHYPRDILGGIIVAFLSYFVVMYIYTSYFMHISYQLS